ncbi:aldo/keto reductase [Actinomadura madurae]|nr:aldo/keto reductase [Actinomadura madurae]MCP9969353.1 aldo/keto reductase [Actinomadura madurae]
MSTPTATFARPHRVPGGYGAGQLDRLHDRRDEAVALLRRAVALGVDHVDTAEFYGSGFANAVIREALRPEDGVLVVTKVGAEPDPGGRLPLRIAQRPEQLRAGVEANLRSLGLDRLPVVNLRRLDAGPGLRPEGDQRVDLDDQLAVMTALRDEGKIGAIGLSSVTLDGLRRALPAGIACVQNAYSLVSRDDEDLLRLCADEGIAWVPYFPSAGPSPGCPRSPRSRPSTPWPSRWASRPTRWASPGCCTAPRACCSSPVPPTPSIWRPTWRSARSRSTPPPWTPWTPSSPGRATYGSADEGKDES